ncbi:RidA family protein [uncultured Bilophila sp.]|uniref:RidA family protein n=1 Tax=uncultured Bilophila sp. TaxID=529385 RepID=UPI00280BD134|nr:RidA family protein [uncultured Bilophila sp.]
MAQNPETGRIDHPGCYEQSLTVLGNIRGILVEARFAPEQVVKMTVFLTDMGQEDAFDRAFEQVFRRTPEEGGAVPRKGAAPGKAARSCPAPRPTRASVWPRFQTPPPWLKWSSKVLPDDGRSRQLPRPNASGFPPAAVVFGTAAGGPPDPRCAPFLRLCGAFFRASPCGDCLRFLPRSCRRFLYNYLKLLKIIL